MELPRVYVETTVPSFYNDLRDDPEIAARRLWTRRWWAIAPQNYELVTSVAVLEELGGGHPKRSAERLNLVSSLPLVPIGEEIGEIVQAYIQHRIMPANPVGDALHLALASYHKCDFLVTWNCQHLANANKFGHIRLINALLGLFVPLLVTPLELLGDDDEDSAI